MATLLGHDEDRGGLIERYLVDLSAELAFRGIGKRRSARVVAEARDHLLELAAEHGDEAAVARFGSPRALAADVARAVQPVVLFRATIVFLVALALFIVPLYAIPENTLPPAPWDERPGYLTWKLYLSLGAFAAALPAALVAAVAAWRQWRTTTLVALAGAGTALAVSVASGTVAAVQWAQAVPGSGTTLLLILLATAFLGSAAAAALASAWRVRRFARDLPS